MGINPAMNHDADISVLGDTEIRWRITSVFSKLNRAYNKVSSYIIITINL